MKEATKGHRLYDSTDDLSRLGKSTRRKWVTVAQSWAGVREGGETAQGYGFLLEVKKMV